MAIETTLRTDAGRTGPRAGAAARLVKAASGRTSHRTRQQRAGRRRRRARRRAPAQQGPERRRRLQDQVARAQQALDYLDRVAGQLDSLKGSLTQTAGRAAAAPTAGQLEARVRQLSPAWRRARKSGRRRRRRPPQFQWPAGHPALPHPRPGPRRAARAAPQSLAFSIGGTAARTVGGHSTRTRRAQQLAQPSTARWRR